VPHHRRRVESKLAGGSESTIEGGLRKLASGPTGADCSKKAGYRKENALQSGKHCKANLFRKHQKDRGFSYFLAGGLIATRDETAFLP